MSANKPEKIFRIGSLSASVFSRPLDGTDRLICSVSLQKRYKDGDETKYTNSFSLGDIPAALRTLQLAQQYVEQHEAEIVLAD